MRQFEEKWRTCTARARQSRGKNESAPFGFATRVLSITAAQVSREPVSLEVIWQRLAVRSLPWVAVLLLICLLLELPHMRDREPMDPGIENTVAQLVWNL